jgi:hypothetical protein
VNGKNIRTRRKNLLTWNGTKLMLM